MKVDYKKIAKELKLKIIENYYDMNFFKNEEDVIKWLKEHKEKLGLEIVEENKGRTPDLVIKFMGEIVRIEVEVFSSNFISHGHKREDVDVVLCIKKNKSLGLPITELEPCHLDKRKKRRTIELSEKIFDDLLGCRLLFREPSNEKAIGLLIKFFFKNLKHKPEIKEFLK